MSPYLSNAGASPPLFHTSFTEPPGIEHWQGDLSFFRIEPGQDPGMLQLNAPADHSTAQLATRHPYSAVHWEWYIRQAFAPSNNNRAFIFLNAETGNLEEEVNGLAIRTGENGTPKHFRLIRFNQGSPTAEWLKSDVQIKTDTGYRIRVLLTPDKEIHLYVAEGRNKTPLLQSEKADASDYGTSFHGHFGFRTHYTATRSDQFYFSDVWISEVLPNPEIMEFSVADNQEKPPSAGNLPYAIHSESADHTQSAVHSHFADHMRSADHSEFVDTRGTVITLTFNVPPDPSYLNTDLFQLDSGQRPEEVRCGHPQICSLVFSEPLSSGEYYLHAGRYRTIYGQYSEFQKIAFLVAEEAGPSDVIINEFMYRPPEHIPAYVELFNSSEKLVNLKNWRLQRRALATEPERIITDEDLFLHPGDYLVLTSDARKLLEMPDVRNIHEMEAFPRFNTSSVDEIRLFSDSDLLVDSLQYLPSSWGGIEVALERKTPAVPGWIRINWSESLAEHGGTPGYANTVRPPLSPPKLLKTDYSSPDSLILVFSRMLDIASVYAPGNILLLETLQEESASITTPLTSAQTVKREIPFSVFLSDSETVTITPSTPLGHGSNYTVQLSGIRDLFGNKMDPTEYGFRYFNISTAEKRDVIINEILYRPDQAHRRRFVELLNRSGEVFDLRGWKIGRSLGNPISFYDETAHKPLFLLSGEKIVISEPGLKITEPTVAHIQIPGFPSLSRFGDCIYLVSNDGETIDSLSYLPEWGGNRDGVSLERLDPEGATSDPSNWKEHPESHSAGKKNYHFDNHPEPVKLLLAAQKNDHEVALYFSRFVKIESLEQVRIGSHRLQLSTQGDSSEYNSIAVLQSQGNIQRINKRVTIPSVKDFAGRVSLDLETPLSYPAEPADIVINEIMYQPLSDRYSNRPDQSEYVEIYNRSGLSLQMRGLFLHDRPDKNGAIQELKPENMEMSSLPPDGFAVIYADTSKLFEKSRIFRAFMPPSTSESVYFRINRMTLGLSTRGDELYLSVQNGQIIDSVWYHPSWHNPNIADVRGISLERIDPDISTQNRDNWTSSASAEGGTPGRPNSVAAPVSASVMRSGLILEPNPFSPDGDGFEDHLVIHYQLDDPDFLIHVRIFDRQGRSVRTLADGQRAGRSGKLIWDGRTDRGLMNRPGLYVIHFEAYNAAIKKRKTYRAVAVLAVAL